MKIEKVSISDVGRLKEIARRAIEKSVFTEAEIKKDIIVDTYRHIDENIKGTECVFLKCSDSLIHGFILVQDYWNLSDLYVSPESHGKGLGKRLFLAAKLLCESNNEKGYIRVNSSLNAEQFYRNLGFSSFTPQRKEPSYIVPLIYNF